MVLSKLKAALFKRKAGRIFTEEERKRGQENSRAVRQLKAQAKHLKHLKEVYELEQDIADAEADLDDLRYGSESDEDEKDDIETVFFKRCLDKWFPANSSGSSVPDTSAGHTPTTEERVTAMLKATSSEQIDFIRKGLQQGREAELRQAIKNVKRDATDEMITMGFQRIKDGKV